MTLLLAAKFANSKAALPGIEDSSMHYFQKVGQSRYFLWILLGSPFGYIVAAYSYGEMYYGEVLHSSGEISARLMMFAMAATPLLLMFTGRAFPCWLTKNRRYFGVASFAYAALHTVVYLDKIGLLPDILADARLPEYWTGWVALLIFLILAASSNDRSVRWLKRRWKSLHRFVYPAAILMFVHWVLVAFNRGPAIAHLALLGGLEGYRIWKLWQISKHAKKSGLA
jgi:sulfoxide reductase heme-binding subunit YedZ